MRVDESDEMPNRMKMGNRANPERVPAEGHEGSTRVSKRMWEENDRRMDHAREMAMKGSGAKMGSEPEHERDPSEHDAGGRGLSG